MKRRIYWMTVALLMGLVAIGGTACTAQFSARPAVVVEPAPVHVVHSPPPRVYHHGHWLHYRSGAYHYYRGGHWVPARSVPARVSRYHRPVHVSRRPAHVQRRAPVRHVRTRPAHVNRRHRKAMDFGDKALVVALVPKDLA